jgi:hypothetical protein
MPRGVYDRSKSKAERATAAAPKKAAPPAKAVAKKAAVEAKQLAPAKASKAQPMAVLDTTHQSEDLAVTFSILGHNLSALTQSYTTFSANSGSSVAKQLEAEISETIKAMKTLRVATFGDASAPATEAKEEIQQTAPAQAAPPVITPTALPAGNPNYTPPAPPTLPSH